MDEDAGEELLVVRRRVRPRLRLAVLLLVLVVAGAGVAVVVVGDRREPDERAALRTCADDLLAAVEDAERRVSAMVSYIAPSVSSSSVSTYEGLYVRVSEQADAALPNVEAARELCAAVAVWWTNRNHRAARDALLLLADVSRDRLERIGQDGSTYVDGYERLVAVREDAESRLTAWGP